MNKGKVFIPQEPMKKDPGGRWVSKGLNLAAATEYGELQIIWGPTASILTRASAEETAQEIASAYSEQSDYIVALGSPSLIAVLSWAIGMEGKQLRMLEWDRKMGRYYPTLSGPAHVVTEKG